MDLRRELQKRFLFDLWCTRKLTDSITTAQPFDDQPACAAFLSHIINMQQIWFGRVIDMNINNTQPWDEHKISDIKPEAKKANQLWLDLIGDHDMEMDEMIYYQNSNGVNHRSRFSEICRHLVIHGQYHRAQIKLFIERSGLDDPLIDYGQYIKKIN